MTFKRKNRHNDMPRAEQGAARSFSHRQTVWIQNVKNLNTQQLFFVFTKMNSLHISLWSFYITKLYILRHQNDTTSILLWSILFINFTMYAILYFLFMFSCPHYSWYPSAFTNGITLLILPSNCALSQFIFPSTCFPMISQVNR